MLNNEEPNGDRMLIRYESLNAVIAIRFNGNLVRGFGKDIGKEIHNRKLQFLCNDFILKANQDHVKALEDHDKR